MSRNLSQAWAALAALGLVAGVAASASAQQSAPAPNPSPVIARVDGRAITQQDFDRLAEPYFERLRLQLKEGFNDDLKKLASKNVLDELIRREILAVEAGRQKLEVSEAETDRVLRQDPYFLTNGKFDQAKLLQYKLSPTGNYLSMLPRIRELAALTKLDSTVRARCKPSAAAVRAEWTKRNDQRRFKFLLLALRDVSLDPEASEAEQAATYAAHPDLFARKPQVRLRLLRLPLPPEGDSLRAGAQRSALARARGLADSLRAGAPIDTLGVVLGGVMDTGLFDLSAAAIPLLGGVPELAAAIAHADSDTALRVVGPAIARSGVVVGLIAERRPRTVPPLRDVIADVKRRADADKRRVALEADRLAFYEAHRRSYVTARARVARVVLRESGVAVKPPAPKDVERWYADHGRTLWAVTDSARTPTPPLDDSLRGVVRERMEREARATGAARALAGVASGWRAGREVRGLARAASAEAETVAFFRGSLADTIFPSGLLDSLFLDPGRSTGVIRGPRELAGHAVVWRLEAVDTAFVPPFDAVRVRVEREFQDEKRQKDEVEGKEYFEAHRTEYRTPPKRVVDYVTIRIPAPDSVTVPEADLRRQYQSHQDAYRQEEQVRARHILIMSRGGEPGSDARARARADSLLHAIRDGADFADLARRFSQDPGSATAGGDLGFFPRGRMVKEFSDTAFALAPGRVSQLVKTQYGYHIIRVDERKPAGVRPFATVRGEIHHQLAQARGDSLARREAMAMRRRIGQGADAAKAAARAGGVQTSPALATNEPIPGVGMVQGLGQDLGTLPLGRWAPQAYKASGAYLLVRPAKRVPAGQAEFADVKAQAVDDMKNAKKKEILAKRVAAVRAQLAEGATLDSVAAIYGGLKDSGLLTRSAGFVPYLGVEPRVLDRAFSLEPGAATDSLTTSQGVVWVRLEEKKTAQGTTFAKDAPAIAEELQTKKYGEWLEQKKKTAKIEILRADLRQAMTPAPQVVTAAPARRGE